MLLIKSERLKSVNLPGCKQVKGICLCDLESAHNADSKEIPKSVFSLGFRALPSNGSAGYLIEVV